MKEEKVKHFSVKLQDHLIKQICLEQQRGSVEYPCSALKINILKPELKKYTIDPATKKT